MIKQASHTHSVAEEASSDRFELYHTALLESPVERVAKHDGGR